MKTKVILHLLITFCLLFTPTYASATGQASERIIINGERLNMLTLPIEQDSVLSTKLRENLKGLPWHTACWRAYIGEWEIYDNTLFLNKLFDCNEKDTINYQKVFDEYKSKGRIKASWYSGELKVVKGKCIYYIHDSFARHYEDEIIYTIKEGEVINHKNLHNTFKEADMTMKDALQAVKDHYRIKKFPELQKSRIRVTLSILPNVNGQFNSFSYLNMHIKTEGDTQEISDISHPYVEELIYCLQKIHNWDVLTLNGQIQGTPIWTFQLHPQRKVTMPTTTD